MTTQLTDALSKHDHKFLFNNMQSPENIPCFYDVFGLYNEYASKNFPYIDEVKSFIVEKLSLSLNSNQLKNLGSYIYYSSCLRDKLKKEARQKELERQGYTLLSADMVKSAYAQKKKVSIVRTGHSMLGFEVEETTSFRPQITADGSCFLMKPRAKTKGYRVEYFIGKGAMAKIV